MATGLERELIYGAGRAAQSHQDIIGAGMDRAVKGVTDAVETVATKMGEVRKEKLAEEEKAKKEEEDLIKGYDKTFESNIEGYEGLPMEVWSRATDLAEEEKVIHDACPIGKEGDRCRKESIMRLKKQSDLFTSANNFMMDQKEQYENYKGDDPKLVQSKYDAESDDGKRRAKIKANMDPKQLTTRMKNDAKIEEINTKARAVSDPAEKEELRKELELLEKTNELVTGWDIPDEGFITQEEIEKLELFKPRADAISKGILDRKKDQIQKNWDPYKDGTGGKPFDFEESIRANKGLLNKGNIASAYYDDVLGTEGTLRENILERPIGRNRLGKPIMLKNASYKDLGITPIGNLDDVIDEDELQEVINALSDPKHPNFNEETSIEIAAEYMALNEEMEYNKHMYGHDFYSLSPGIGGGQYRRKIELTSPSVFASEREAREAGVLMGSIKGRDQVWDEARQKYVSRIQEGELD